MGAEEAVVVPVAVLERDELGAADARDGLAAREAPLREQLPEAVRAVRLVVAAGEARARQAALAVRAREALPVPRLVLVRHSSACDHLQIQQVGSVLNAPFP